MKCLLTFIPKRAGVILLLLVLFAASSLRAQVYEEKEEVSGITSVCELKDIVMKAGKTNMDLLRGKQYEREVNKAPIWQSKIASALFERNLTSFGDRDGSYYLGEKHFETEAGTIAFHDKLLNEITACTGVAGFKRYGYEMSFKPVVSITNWMSDYYKTENIGERKFFIITLIRTSENLVRLKISSYSRSYYMENVDYYDSNKFLRKAKQFKLNY
jgi:hypothetical protein